MITRRGFIQAVTVTASLMRLPFIPVETAVDFSDDFESNSHKMRLGLINTEGCLVAAMLVDFVSTADGDMTNSRQVNFPTATRDWGVVNRFVVFDEKKTLRWCGNFMHPMEVRASDQVSMMEDGLRML